MVLPLRWFRPFLGARIIKTGLAVFLTLVISHLLAPEYSAFAAVAAILAVQPSVARARQVFTHQLLSNLIGGLVGALLGLWLGSSPLAMALSVVVVLGICVRLRLNETASLAVVAVLFIMDRPEHDFILYTAVRIGAVVGGMSIGYLVNRFVLRPDFTARIREELRAAAADVDKFGNHLLASLAAPEHYLKEQIKTEAAAIKDRLDTAGYWLDLLRESGNPTGRVLRLQKVRTSLYVFVERITDIHKIVLQAGGLTPGDEFGAVAGALKAVLQYKANVVAASAGEAELDESLATAHAEALGALDRLVLVRIADSETRQRGLHLHSLLTNVRHMAWRMESLARLLQDPTT